MSVSARYLVGDVVERLVEIPDESVDLVVTSPPFLALRSYLPSDHPDKHREIGSEATPADFLDTLLGLTAEWGRVLAPHGSLCVELGDTYAGTAASGWDRLGARATQDDQPPNYRKAGTIADSGTRSGGPGWPLTKSLTGIPTLYAWSLAYGRNLLTGEESPAGQWRIRNLICWARPNPPVGCVDEQTEALTLDGWKRHDELSDGDMIAAYDPATDSCRFQPAKFVRWHRENEPMVSIDKRATSQLLTEDHRAWVRTAKREPHVRLAADITNDCQTLLCAPFDDVAGPEPVTVERAELLGWFIAEGTPHHQQARIRQSVTANPEKVARIRALLDADGADYRESVYHRGVERAASRSHKPPVDALVTFHVKGELAEWLNLHHKRLPMHYATTWPERQARALFDGLIDGDGHRRKSRGILFHQQDEDVADAVQVIGLRLGYRVSKSWQPSLGLWQLTMSNAPVQDRRWTKVRKWDGEGVPRESYTGVVWCPQVETTMWLARRNGRTFVTGNSLGDKFRPATSYITVATKATDRWFDLDAVRGPGSPNTQARTAKGVASRPSTGKTADDSRRGGNWSTLNTVHATNGAPPLDWHADGHPEDGDWLWKLPTAPYKGSHYATFPPALPKRLIEAMCPREVCESCGEPRRRITSNVRTLDGEPMTTLRPLGDDKARRVQVREPGNGRYATTTTGWTACDCAEPTCRDGAGQELADADGARHEGAGPAEPRGVGEPRERSEEPRRTQQWPPTRDDADGWREWIAEGGPKPTVRRGPDGRPAELADALHLGGNGLVPAVAAVAFTSLLDRLRQERAS